MLHKIKLGLMFTLLAIVASHSVFAEVKLSGFVKVDGLYDLAQKSGDRINYNSIKTGEDTQSAIDNHARIHARQTRLRLTVDQDQFEVPIKGVVEIDFYGGGTDSPSGSETISNSVSPRLRLAYIEYDAWLIGQDWSTFVDVKSFPETLDFANDTGQAFLRQGLVRYNHKIGNWQLSAALENPEADLYQSGTAYAELDPFVDVTARGKYVADWGHISLQTVLRFMEADDLTSSNVPSELNNETQTGFGLGASGRINAGENSQFRFHISGGRGIGRYIQEASGYAGYILNEDNSSEYALLNVYGGYLAFQYRWTESLRSNISTGYLFIDWPDALKHSTDADQLDGAIESFHSLHTNLIWTFNPQTQVGIEYSLAKKTDFNSDAPSVLIEEKGFVRRLQASFTYKF